jgi:hypothetical protein
MIKKNIFAEKYGEQNGGFFAQTSASFCKHSSITFVFEEKRQFFHRKLAKITENCNQNIDPSIPAL